MKTSRFIAAALFATVLAPAASATDAAQNAFTAQLSADANAEQVRKLLQAKKYSKVKVLSRDDDGRWNAIAVKNGKTSFVSVHLPTNRSVPAVN